MDHHMYDHESATIIWRDSNSKGWLEGDADEDKLPGLLKDYSTAGLARAINARDELIAAMQDPKITQSGDDHPQHDAYFYVPASNPLSIAMRLRQLDVPISVWAALKKNSDVMMRTAKNLMKDPGTAVTKIEQEVAVHKALFRKALYTAQNCKREQGEFTDGFFSACETFSNEISIGVFAINWDASYTFVVPLDFFAKEMYHIRLGLKVDQYVNVEFAEKALMLCKAAIHGDVNAFNSISEADTPKECQMLGRGVKNFNQGLWDSMICAVAYEIVYQKFTKLPRLQSLLLSTEGLLIVEAANYDTVWGSGLPVDDSDLHDPKRWRDTEGTPGANVLGWALMSVRNALRTHPGFQHSEIEVKGSTIKALSDSRNRDKWFPGKIVHTNISSGMITVEIVVPGKKYRKKIRKPFGDKLRLRDPRTGVFTTFGEYWRKADDVQEI